MNTLEIKQRITDWCLAQFKAKQTVYLTAYFCRKVIPGLNYAQPEEIDFVLQCILRLQREKVARRINDHILHRAYICKRENIKQHVKLHK